MKENVILEKSLKFVRIIKSSEEADETRYWLKLLKESNLICHISNLPISIKGEYIE